MYGESPAATLDQPPATAAAETNLSAATAAIGERNLLAEMGYPGEPAALPDMPGAGQDSIGVSEAVAAEVAPLEATAATPEVSVATDVAAPNISEENLPQAMGYQFVPDGKNALPADGTEPAVEPFAAANQPLPTAEAAAAPPQNETPQATAEAASPVTAEGETMSLDELEAQMDAETAKLQELDPSPASAASKLGAFIGGKIASLKEKWASTKDRSEILRFARAIDAGYTEFKNAYAAHSKVKSELRVENGRVSFSGEKPPVVAPAQAEAVPQRAVEKPPVASEVPSTPEQPLSRNELLGKGYENFVNNPALLTEISKVSEFFEKHNIAPDLQNELLAKRYGADTAAFVQALKEDGSDLSFVSEMIELGFSPEEATLMLAPRESAAGEQATEAEAENQTEEAAAQTDPAARVERNTIPQAVLERNQTRSAPEGRVAAENTAALEVARRRELFEQINVHKGMSSSDLPVTAQLNAMRAEAFRLQQKLQATPPEELERHVRNSTSTIDKNGKESTGWTTFEYDGNIDSPEATSAALLDTSVKLEAVGAVARAQSAEFANDSDKLGVAERLMKERFGSNVSVEVRRGNDENEQPITSYEQGKHSMSISYENGSVVLKVQSLGSEDGASNNLESNFTRKEK